MDNNEKLLQKFINASIKYGEAIEIGDSKKANKQSAIVRGIRQQLIASDELQILTPILQHDNDYVRLSVATSLIFIMPQESKRVLIELQNKRGLLAFEAEIFLQEWEKGNMKIDPIQNM